MPIDKHLICTRPFEWMEIANTWVIGKPQPHVYQCCYGMVTIPTGSLQYNGVYAVWNNGISQQIRKSVIDGSFKYCKIHRCSNLHDKTGPVQYVDDKTLQYYESIVNEEIDIPPPKMFTTSYDQTCNLKCPSCRDEIRGSDKETIKYHDKLFMDIYNEYWDQLQYIRFTDGGDPFASTHLWEILLSDVLCWNPYLNIQIQTNALLFNKKHWDKISHLHKQINWVKVSIDAATNETYQINRGGCWDTLLKNLQFISEIHKQYKFFWQIAFVVQTNNWREMELFAQLGSTLGVDMVTFVPLHNWGTYSDVEYKDRAIHFTSHPDNSQFISYVKNSKILQQPFVFITEKLVDNNLILVGSGI